MKLRVQFAGCMIALGISAGLALPCAAQQPRNNNDRPPRQQQAQPRQEQHQQHRQDRPVRAPSPQRERAYTPPPRNPAGNNSPAGPARAIGGGKTAPQSGGSSPRLIAGRGPKAAKKEAGVQPRTPQPRG